MNLVGQGQGFGFGEHSAEASDMAERLTTLYTLQFSG